jgi:hypothetical protein
LRSSSGSLSRIRLCMRPRKACEWRTCGEPRRCQARNASSGVAGSGAASFSKTVTRWPLRASASDVASPAIEPPMTMTWLAILLLRDASVADFLLTPGATLAAPRRPRV